MSRTLQPGDVIGALFPGHHPKGREQEGSRHAIVVGLPEALGTPRYLVDTEGML